MWLSRKDDPNQAPNQNCVFCVIVGNLKFISNQISLWSGLLLIGKVAGTPKKKLCGETQVLICNKFQNRPVQIFGHGQKMFSAPCHCWCVLCPGESCEQLSAHGWGLHCDWWRWCWCCCLPAPELNIVSTAATATPLSTCASTAPTLSHSNLS